MNKREEGAGENISAIERSQGEAAIATTLNFMVAYAEFHFSAEEKHMANPDLDH